MTGTLTIFDIDGTLFNSYARVHVRYKGEILMSLDANNYHMHENSSYFEYDYSEFASAELFKQTAEPIIHMIELAKDVVKAHDNPFSEAIIITARPDMDDKELFLQVFRDHGIEIDEMYVHRIGGNDKWISAPEAKKDIIREYLETGDFSKVRFYEDSKDNLDAFLELKSEFPDIDFEPYIVAKNGDLSVYGS